VGIELGNLNSKNNNMLDSKKPTYPSTFCENRDSNSGFLIIPPIYPSKKYEIRWYSELRNVSRNFTRLS